MGNNTSDTSLFKTRSTGACIKSGLNLFTANFKNIFKYTWKAALLSTIICGLIIAYNFSVLFDILKGSAQTENKSSLFLILIAEGIYIVACSLVMKPLYDHKKLGHIPANHKLLSLKSLFARKSEITGCMLSAIKAPFTALRKRNSLSHAQAKPLLFFFHNPAWRYVKASCFFMIILCVLTFIISWGVFKYSISHEMSQTVLISSAIAFLLVTLLISVPIPFISTRYSMDCKLRFWRSLISSYGLAFRYSFKIYLLFIIYVLVYIIVGCIMLLPLFVLALALSTALSGAIAYGDPLNLPDYMVYIIGGTVAVELFFLYYLIQASTFPIYYLYGSIEMREKNRKNSKRQQSPTKN